MADPSVLELATELIGQTRLSDADWNKVETTAQALANSLRVKNGVCHSLVSILRVKTMHPRRYSGGVGRHAVA
jgi:hypothetical protein